MIDYLGADALIDEPAGDYVGEMPVDEELAALQMLEDEIARERHGVCMCAHLRRLPCFKVSMRAVVQLLI